MVLTEEGRELYRHGLHIVSRRVTDYQRVGQSLLDKKKEFSNCCHC